ncbi:MAG: RT0821/Lpp0805 family surface protein, partial [Deferrisomatales bacterium]
SRAAPAPAGAGPHRRHRHPPPHGHGCDPVHWHRAAPAPWTPAYRYPAPGHGGGRELLGSLLGGAAGGVLGAQVGGGSGRVAAIVGGTVLGVLAGGGVGRSLDQLDRWRLGQTLESLPTRESAAWRDPDRDRTYVVTPTATYRAPDGRYCREYQATATIAGAAQQVYGTACRQPDGSWEIVD